MSIGIRHTRHLRVIVPHQSRCTHAQSGSARHTCDGGGGYSAASRGWSPRSSGNGQDTPGSSARRTWLPTESTLLT